jgi:hypothetical protein
MTGTFVEALIGGDLGEFGAIRANTSLRRWSRRGKHLALG